MDVLETGTFPLPWHEEDKLSARFWLERYLYFARRDGVEPEPDDFFYRCLRNGRFTAKRWGYKKYNKLLQHSMVMIPMDLQVCFIGLVFFSEVWFRSGHSGRVSSTSRCTTS